MDNRHVIGFLCCSPAWGGLEINVLRLAGWLRERGHKVVIYCRQSTHIQKEAHENGFPVRVLSLSRRYGGPITAWRLARLARADGVRIMTVHSNQDMFMSAFAKTLAGASFRLVYFQHMQIGRDKKDPVHSWEFARLDSWVTPLGILADGVATKTRMDMGKVQVIPFGIELDRFTLLPDRATARRRLGLPEQAVVVGMIGRLDPLKGQDTLVRALSELHRSGHKAYALLAGDRTWGEAESFAEQIDRLVDELHLKAHIIFVPFSYDIQYVYAALNVFVLTSHSETYGMVTIEAMASGLPVIATDSGGTPGLITDEIDGLLVPPAKPDRLAAALVRLLEDRDLAARLAANARSRAVASYSHRSQCIALESLFDRMTINSV